MITLVIVVAAFLVWVHADRLALAVGFLSSTVVAVLLAVVGIVFRIGGKAEKWALSDAARKELQRISAAQNRISNS